MGVKKAQSIDEIYKFTSPKPLVTEKDLDNYYCKDVNDVRGNDIVERLSLMFSRCSDDNFCKQLITGHFGVGKSTEISRLICKIAGNFKILRFSVIQELDPGAFKPFDILLYVAVTMVEQMVLPPSKNGEGIRLDPSLLQKIVDWFAIEEVTFNETKGIAGELQAGAGMDADSWWAKLFGLFGSIKGEMKYASSREKQRTEYRIQRMAPLMSAVNDLMDECNNLLYKKTQQEWIIVGEDFEKVNDKELLEAFFIGYSSILKDWRVHQLFTLPIQLAWCDKAPMLPFYPPLNIPDIPVYTAEHKPHSDGRNAVTRLVYNRLEANLFNENQLERLIVASGGNIRDLFNMINRAADSAILRKATDRKIGSEDVNVAIKETRADYRHKLGDNIVDKNNISYSERANKLMEIYNCEPASKIPDERLHSLLRSKAVQEFNGECWLGVHPLVVDILAEQKRIESVDGIIPGGTI